MSEETQVSDEAVVDNGTENNTQEPAQNEYIAESKKYRKRAQDAETRLAKLEQQLQSQENAKLKEKEEFKTLAEKLEAENTSLSSYKDKYEDDVCDWGYGLNHQLINRWKLFKKFVEKEYNNVNIEVVNPIGLKNIFKEYDKITI